VPFAFLFVLLLGCVVLYFKFKRIRYHVQPKLPS
jgi:hypothetical protein